MMRHVDLATPAHQGPVELSQADDVRIGDMGAVIRAAGNGVELASMKFGFPPPRPRAGPVFNFKSEGRHFDKSNRCLVPASAFFEFTGTKYPKAKHRFTLAGSSWMAIAALWRVGPDGPSFAMLTTTPGPDIEPYHDRQVVVLRPATQTRPAHGRAAELARELRVVLGGHARRGDPCRSRRHAVPHG
jgi:putative SOS response-associated peptidase YedK